MLSVRTNVSGINATRNMGAVSTALGKSMERLSSGFRINRAGDDAAGLAISEKLKSQVRGLNQAARNSMDGISMLQTAEAGMDELQAMMQRMRELAVQGANSTLGSSERENIWSEVDQLRQEMTNIAQRTQFNGQGLLNGNLATSLDSTSELKLGTALATGQAAAIGAIDVSKALTNSGAVRSFKFSSGGAGQITLTDQTDTTKNQTLTIADGDFNTAYASKELNFDQLGIKVTLQVGQTAGKTAANVITDLTTAATDTITTAQGNGSAQIQSGANNSQTTTVAFNNVDIATVANATGSAGLFALNSHLTGAGNMGTQANRNASAFGTLIARIDSALGDVSTQRANLGAYQNRLEHSIANVKAASENLAASNSRIRDVDVAEESSALAKSQIMMQAGVSVLAQANQQSQLALKLLG